MQDTAILLRHSWLIFRRVKLRPEALAYVLAVDGAKISGHLQMQVNMFSVFDLQMHYLKKWWLVETAEQAQSSTAPLQISQF